jgi:hypothetical protein
LKNAYAQEVEKCENLTKELSICHDSISSLRNENASLVSKIKVVAKYVGGKHKSSKTCVWVPKVLVSNVKGPKTVWVPKNKA